MFYFYSHSLAYKYVKIVLVHVTPPRIITVQNNFFLPILFVVYQQNNIAKSSADEDAA